MYDTDVVSTRVHEVLTTFSKDDYPETYDYLFSIIEADGDVKEDPVTIAVTVMDRDGLSVFPDTVIEFVEQMFNLAIEQGNDHAMVNLGAWYYEGGRGFRQNFKAAVRLYEMASERGNRTAQENLGYCYYYGRVAEPDYERAFRYFALGAFDKSLVSLYKIADMYHKGLYVEQDDREAFALYMRCLRELDENSESRVAGPVYLRLADMLFSGVGCDRDVKAAMVCYQKAELYLTDMVLAGDVMYKASLASAIAGQQKVRDAISGFLPKATWELDE